MFRDVVIHSSSSAALVSLSSQASAPTIPRIILRSEVHRPPPARQVPKAEGWVRVEPWAAHNLRARGKCFNCFSSGHRAGQCRSRPRCFHCQAVVHRSYVCPDRSTKIPVWRRISPAPQLPSAAPVKSTASVVMTSSTDPGGGRVSVWQRISTPSQQPAAPAGVQEQAGNAGAASAGEACPCHRRWRQRHRRRANEEDYDPASNNEGNGEATSPTPPGADDGTSPALNLP